VQGTAYRSVFRNAAYIFFIKLFPAIAILIVGIVFSRKLPEADYGIYQNFWIKLLLLGTVAYAGIPVALITYPAAVIRQFAKQIQSRYYLLYVGWLALSAVVFFYAVAASIHITFLLAAGLLLLYVIHAVQESLLLAAKKMNGLLVLNLIYSFYFLYIHFASLNNFNLTQLLWYLFAGMFVRAVCLAFIIYAVYTNVQQNTLSQDYLKKAKNLWLHLGFYDLLQNIFRFADKFILSFFLPAGLCAIYFNGSQTADIPLLPYLLGAVASSVLIQLSDATTDVPSYRYMFQAGKLLSCIIFPLFFFLFFFGEEFIVVIFSAKYQASVRVFLCAILVLPLRAYNYTTLLQHLHKGALINKGAVLDLILGLILMYPLYLLFDLPGITLSFVISTYVQVAYYLFHTSKLTGVSITKLLPLKNWTTKFIICGILLFTFHYLLQQSFAPDVTLIGGAIAGLALGIIFLGTEGKVWRKR